MENYITRCFILRLSVILKYIKYFSPPVRNRIIFLYYLRTELYTDIILSNYSLGNASSNAIYKLISSRFIIFVILRINSY